MNRQTWNWCETIINGLAVSKIIRYEDIFFIDYEIIKGCNLNKCNNFVPLKDINCLNITCLECWSLHYPAKREGCWTYIRERIENMLLGYLTFYIRSTYNPQGVKYE